MKFIIFYCAPLLPRMLPEIDGRRRGENSNNIFNSNNPKKASTHTFFRSAKIRGLPLLHITDVPLKLNSILAMSSSISSLSRSAMTTTIPPPKLSLAIAS